MKELRLIEYGRNEAHWVLYTDEILDCRHCGKKNIMAGYYCKKDGNISCLNCLDKDNNLGHAKLYVNPHKENEPHIHFKVNIEKPKIIKEPKK